MFGGGEWMDIRKSSCIFRSAHPGVVIRLKPTSLKFLNPLLKINVRKMVAGGTGQISCFLTSFLDQLCCQEVSRCYTRDEPVESIAHRHGSTQVKDPP